MFVWFGKSRNNGPLLDKFSVFNPAACTRSIAYSCFVSTANRAQCIAFISYLILSLFWQLCLALARAMKCGAKTKTDVVYGLVGVWTIICTQAFIVIAQTSKNNFNFTNECFVNTIRRLNNKPIRAFTSKHIIARVDSQWCTVSVTLNMRYVTFAFSHSRQSN